MANVQQSLQPSTTANSTPMFFGQQGSVFPYYPQNTSSAPKNMALQSKAAQSTVTPSNSSNQTYTPTNNSPVQPTIQSQISSLQSKLNDAKNAGYSGSQQIQTDASGNVVPIKQPGVFQQAVTGLNTTGQGQNASNVTDAMKYLQGQAGTNAAANQENIQKSAGMLTGFAQNESPEVQKQTTAYNQFAQENPYMLAAQSNPNVAADVASGRSGLLGDIFARELNAKSQAVANAYTGQSQQINSAENLGTQGLTGQQQQIVAANNAGNIGVAQQNAQTTALNAAGNLAQPVQVPYNNQYINPLTGQSVAGGAMTGGTSALSQLPQNAQEAVNSYAQQVKSGLMTRSDAESRLGSYGIAGTNALNEVLGAGFNTITANATAGAAGTNVEKAGNINAAITSANLILGNESTNGKSNSDTLSGAFDNLGQLQHTGSSWIGPLINQISNGTTIGQGPTQNYARLLAEARARVNVVLNSANNLGVNTSGVAAENVLPDNMTRSGLDTAIQTIKSLESQVTKAYGNPSNANTQNQMQSPTGSSGTLPSGAQFKLVNGIYVKA